MCLGIPGQVVAVVDAERRLATVAVAGVRRTVDVGLLDAADAVPGAWVLIHVGFALTAIDEGEARRTLASLEAAGTAYADEVRALTESRIT